MDVIILAAGKGSRMEVNLPKSLVVIRGKPIISHRLDYLLKFKEINKIIIETCYKQEEIINYIKSNYNSPKIVFSTEDELTGPYGTAGGVKNALLKSSSEFVLVTNCDDITDIDISRLSEVKENTICIAHPRLRFGRVKEEKGYASFEEKPLLADWVSCGWYIFNKKQIFSILPDRGSLEYDIFPKIKLRVYKHNGFWKTMNNQKEVSEFETSLKFQKS